MRRMAKSRSQPPLLALRSASASGPVDCLGRPFASDAARRAHYLELLRAKLADPEFRKTPGFPEAADEEILRLSDPPWYTACPNPSLGNFVRVHGRPYDAAEEYRRDPFAVDVIVGKTHALYKAHGYHTKVPHLAIVPSILHYTKPGDLVLDGFCGSGMTDARTLECVIEHRQQVRLALSSLAVPVSRRPLNSSRSVKPSIDRLRSGRHGGRRCVRIAIPRWSVTHGSSRKARESSGARCRTTYGGARVGGVGDSPSGRQDSAVIRAWGRREPMVESSRGSVVVFPPEEQFCVRVSSSSRFVHVREAFQ